MSCARMSAPEGKACPTAPCASRTGCAPSPTNTPLARSSRCVPRTVPRSAQAQWSPAVAASAADRNSALKEVRVGGSAGGRGSRADNLPRVRARPRPTRTAYRSQRDAPGQSHTTGSRDVKASARAGSSRADRVAMTSHPCSVTSPRARPQEVARRPAAAAGQHTDERARTTTNSRSHFWRRNPFAGQHARASFVANPIGRRGTTSNESNREEPAADRPERMEAPGLPRPWLLGKPECLPPLGRHHLGLASHHVLYAATSCVRASRCC
jgi:hypothetical protein